MSHVMPTYFNRLPIAFERGEGVWLFDQEGVAYFDALTGIAVCGLGHAHPDITKTIAEQSAKLIHTSNNYQIPLQEQLAANLCAISGMEQVYFCNSGAETNEAAIKLSRLFARKKNIACPIVITLFHSFHGRTMATLSASGTPRIQAGFEPLVPEFIYAELNDFVTLEQWVKNNKNIVGIMLEPVQGDGGIRIAQIEYLQNIRALCDAHDLLMILDEVQTGMGRTGTWFAYQQAKLLPDIVTVAKTLGNGFPIGACLARGKAANLFGPGKHGTTFGGNPLGCAVALTVIEVIKTQQLLNNVQQISTYLLDLLHKQFADEKNITEIRAKGLMIGIELNRPCLDIVNLALKHRLLINVVANNTIRLLPALNLTKQEADELVKRLTHCLLEFLY